jgi:hypothetical protein
MIFGIRDLLNGIRGKTAGEGTDRSVGSGIVYGEELDAKAIERTKCRRQSEKRGAEAPRTKAIEAISIKLEEERG